MTHTFVLMELSDAAYAEIKAQMEAAGYQHAFDEQGNIDMHGIAVNRTVASLNTAYLNKAQSGETLFEHRGDGTVWGKLPDGRFVELGEKPTPRADGLHCSTCQCGKLPSQDERHVPGNPRSRSWHKNAPNGAPK
jgi:hypothetical protein